MSSSLGSVSDDAVEYPTAPKGKKKSSPVRREVVKQEPVRENGTADLERSLRDMRAAYDQAQTERGELEAEVKRLKKEKELLKRQFSEKLKQSILEASSNASVSTAHFDADAEKKLRVAEFHIKKLEDKLRQDQAVRDDDLKRAEREYTAALDKREHEHEEEVNRILSGFANMHKTPRPEDSRAFPAPAQTSAEDAARIEELTRRLRDNEEDRATARAEIRRLEGLYAKALDDAEIHRLAAMMNKGHTVTIVEPAQVTRPTQAAAPERAAPAFTRHVPGDASSEDEEFRREDPSPRREREVKRDIETNTTPERAAATASAATNTSRAAVSPFKSNSAPVAAAPTQPVGVSEAEMEARVAAEREQATRDAAREFDAHKAKALRDFEAQRAQLDAQRAQLQKELDTAKERTSSLEGRCTLLTNQFATVQKEKKDLEARIVGVAPKAVGLLAERDKDKTITRLHGELERKDRVIANGTRAVTAVAVLLVLIWLFLPNLVCW